MINPYNYLQDYVGKTITYEEFCEITKEPILELGSKTKQLKVLNNFMNIIPSYGKITITNIYDEKELLFLEHRAKFTEYIEDLLILHLSKDNTHKVTMTYSEMAKYFYMVNNTYYETKNNKRWEYINALPTKSTTYYSKEDSENDKYRDIGIFFNVTDKIIKEIVNNALKSLKQRSLILYSDTFKLYKMEYNETLKKYIQKEYICNEHQRSIFLDIRKKTMKEYGIKKLQDIIYLSKEIRADYFKVLSDRLKDCDELYNCPIYANAWNIEYGENGIKHEAKRILSQNKKLVNSNMQYKLLTTKELECMNQALRERFVEDLI